MTVTVERTLFLLDPGTFDITITTWGGEEATVPVSHLYALVDRLRAAGVAVPAPLPPADGGLALPRQRRT